MPAKEFSKFRNFLRYYNIIMSENEDVRKFALALRVFGEPLVH